MEQELFAIVTFMRRQAAFQFLVDFIKDTVFGTFD